MLAIFYFMYLQDRGASDGRPTAMAALFPIPFVLFDLFRWFFAMEQDRNLLLAIPVAAFILFLYAWPQFLLARAVAHRDSWYRTVIGASFAINVLIWLWLGAGRFLWDVGKSIGDHFGLW